MLKWLACPFCFISGGPCFLFYFSCPHSLSPSGTWNSSLLSKNSPRESGNAFLLSGHLLMMTFASDLMVGYSTELQQTCACLWSCIGCINRLFTGNSSSIFGLLVGPLDSVSANGIWLVSECIVVLLCSQEQPFWCRWQRLLAAETGLSLPSDRCCGGISQGHISLQASPPKSVDIDAYYLRDLLVNATCHPAWKPYSQTSFSSTSFLWRFVGGENSRIWDHIFHGVEGCQLGPRPCPWDLLLWLDLGEALWWLSCLWQTSLRNWSCPEICRGLSWFLRLPWLFLSRQQYLPWNIMSHKDYCIQAHFQFLRIELDFHRAPSVVPENVCYARLGSSQTQPNHDDDPFHILE